MPGIIFQEIRAEQHLLGWITSSRIVLSHQAIPVLGSYQVPPDTVRRNDVHRAWIKFPSWKQNFNVLMNLQTEDSTLPEHEPGPQTSEPLRWMLQWATD
jgi:hypothetical protein